jgi:hypothetical protein
MRHSIILTLAIVALLATAHDARGQLGPLKKKLIEYGWDVPTPKQISQHLPDMEKRPFDGIIFKLAGGFNAFIRKPLDPAAFADDERILKALKFKRFKDNFFLVWGTAEEGWDWFDDAQWTAVLANTRILAHAGRAAGGHGICFDPEPYGINPWDYAKQAQASRHTFEEYRRKVRERGASFMRALEKEVPSPVVLTFFHVSLISDLLDEPDAARLEARLKAKRWGLMPDFLIGMLSGGSARARFVDGNEGSYYYEGREPYFRTYHTTRLRALNLIPEELREKYRRQVQVGMALYVDHLFALRQPNTERYLSYKLTPEERARWFEHNTYYALYTTDEYVWCYSERMNWWTNDVPQGLEDAIVEARRRISAGAPLDFEIEPLLKEAKHRSVAPRP